MITTDIVRACLPAGPAVGGAGRALPRILLGVLVFFLLCLVAVGQTQEEKEKIKTTTTTKEVQGEVTWIGKDKMAIVYKRDTVTGGEYEILLPYEEKDLKIVHKKNLSEINKGDIVNVKYEYEEIIEEPLGEKKINYKAKVISFVKPAMQKPQAAQPAGEEEAGLPLKGIK